MKKAITYFIFGVLAVMMGFWIAGGPFDGLRAANLSSGMEAFGAGENQFRILKPTEFAVRVGGQCRILKVWFDKEGNQHLEYFKEDSNHLILLGEEIFDQDDNKVSDSYIENNGDWPQGYNRRFR
jgi:hypothetical protein